MPKDNISKIFAELEKCNFKVSKDTRKDVSGSIYFALKGGQFDGNTFVYLAMEKGAVGAIADDPRITGENIYLVDDALETLQTVAQMYKELFSIPIIVIGGSNGKTTSKGLIGEVLKTKYKVHAAEESLNNHFGVPLSILSMDREIDIGIFEIGANHPGEHTTLLNLLNPTIVVVTNNGMDHLEGFGSPSGAREANKEIYNWASSHSATAFVDKNQSDLMKDSKNLERIKYPLYKLEITNSTPLTIQFEGKQYITKLTGDYNVENIQLALSVGAHFKIEADQALNAICEYVPASKRSQFVKKGNVGFVVDCYNANPSSVELSLDSFLKSIGHPRGVILGDMLELGSYSDAEHLRVVEYISKQDLESVVFIGSNFKKILGNEDFKYQWFADSDKAREWFSKQNFDGYTFLLKGSRGVAVENILE